MLEDKRIERPDPVLSFFGLPHKGLYHPFGFSLEVATNCKQVLEVAEETWGHLRKEFAEPALRLSIGVREGESSECPPAPVVRARGSLMAFVADRDNFGVCDMRQGFAFRWVTKAAVANRAYLRYHCLEAAAYVLLDALYLTPLHAACVALGGRGLLLCGDSGAGKSSLAYACARRGWTLVCEDCGSLVRSRRDNIVAGDPRVIRLRESAVELFPELQKRPLTLRSPGERVYEVAAGEDPKMATSLRAPVEGILFLRRGASGRPAFLPHSRRDALRWFAGEAVCYGEPEIQEAQLASLRKLVSLPVLDFRYSELEGAVAMMEAFMSAPAGSQHPPEACGERPQNG